LCWQTSYRVARAQCSKLYREVAKWLASCCRGLLWQTLQPNYPLLYISRSHSDSCSSNPITCLASPCHLEHLCVVHYHARHELPYEHEPRGEPCRLFSW